MNAKYTHLVVSDMDYTLLLPSTEVTKANLDAINRLRESGIAFAIATGRTSFLITRYTDSLDIHTPCITSNGGALYDPDTKTDVVSYDLDDSTVYDLLCYLFDNHIDFAGYSTEGIFMPNYSSRIAFIENYNKDLPEEKKAKWMLFEEGTNSKTLNRNALPKFNKILVVTEDKAVTDKIRARSDVSCVFSTSTFLDVMRTGISKGSAMLELADLLDIPHSNVCAIGDSENDISMLSMASLSIAMGNASPEVKDICTNHTTSCEEDGFAHAVDTIILPWATSSRH